MSERSFRRAQARKAAAASRRDAARRRAGLVVGAAVGASALFTAAAQADTFTVNTLTDGAANGCDDGTCTLRDAISDANANPGADTITFAADLNGTIQLTDGQLDQTEGDLTIAGPGASTLTVAADEYSRILQVEGEAVALSGLTLTGGDVEGAGGAITSFDGAALSISDSTLSGNAAADGGAVYADNGSLTVTNSTFTGNVAKYGAGGAINTQDADLHITGSTLSGNKADGNRRNRGEGGAIAATSNQNIGNGSLTVATSIDRSTISGNTAQAGGGIMVNPGALTLTDSTVADNAASQFGGGFSVFGRADIARSKITGNTSTAGGGGVLQSTAASTVDQTTFSGNRVTGAAPNASFGQFQQIGGGGLLSLPVKYGTVISRSTLSGNTVEPGDPESGFERSGGGLQVVSYFGAGVTQLKESTVSGNTADRGAGVEVSSKYGDNLGPFAGGSPSSFAASGSTIASNSARITGGGIHLSATQRQNNTILLRAAATPGTSTVSLSSTVVADNTAAGAPQDLTSDGAPDSFGGFDAFFSLIETPGNAPFHTSVASGSGVDPQLGALADNGGPTQTQAPSGTSPLIDRGKAAVDALTDQRGSARVVDTALPNAANGDGSDIGAVELPVSSVVGGSGGIGTPLPTTPATTPPVVKQQFSATIRNRGIGQKDIDGKPALLLANSTGVNCSVTTGSIKLCDVEVRAPIAFRIPGSRRTVAKGALLASGISTVTRDAQTTAVKVQLSPIGRALLGRRPLGVPATITAKAVSTTGPLSATGAVRLLKSNAIRIATHTRSETLAPSVLSQIDAAATVFKRTAGVTCDAYTDGGADPLALTTLQAKAACSRLIKAGVQAKTTARGHSAPHLRKNPTLASRLANRRIVLRFTF